MGMVLHYAKYENSWQVEKGVVGKAENILS